MHTIYSYVMIIKLIHDMEGINDQFSLPEPLVALKYAQ